MEGYPYSQRQAVCQYPSPAAQKGSTVPQHSTALEKHRVANWLKQGKKKEETAQVERPLAEVKA